MGFVSLILLRALRPAGHYGNRFHHNFPFIGIPTTVLWPRLAHCCIPCVTLTRFGCSFSPLFLLPSSCVCLFRFLSRLSFAFLCCSFLSRPLSARARCLGCVMFCPPSYLISPQPFHFARRSFWSFLSSPRACRQFVSSVLPVRTPTLS